MNTGNIDLKTEIKVEIEEEYPFNNGIKEQIISNKPNGKHIPEEYCVPKTIKQEKIDTKNEEKRDQFSTYEFKEEQIQEEYFDSESIKQEEIQIKSEDEEANQFIIETSGVKSGKGFHPINKAARLNNSSRIDTNNCRANVEHPGFKCFKCSYQTHKKRNMAGHVLNHMSQTFECSLCPYKCKRRKFLKQHKIMHIPKDEAKLYKCPQCLFTSKRKAAITRHLLLHKKPGEITWYKCPQCPYTTIWKRSLPNHLLVHKKPDEITWYYCPQCPYKTKRKSNLVYSHMTIHEKDQSIYKCTSCSYESPRKCCLQTHMRHMHGLVPPDESTWYQCPECPYITSNLQNRDVCVHRSDRPKNYKCSECPFETKYRICLKAHKLSHENPDKWFSCPLCPFKTTFKTSLNNHALTHKSDREINWFRCSECSYTTKRKQTLDRHKLKHGSDRFYCYLCLFRTIYKRSLAMHIRNKHRDADGRIRPNYFRNSM